MLRTFSAETQRYPARHANDSGILAMTEKISGVCRYCGEKVPERAGRGRPHLYDSIGCRRAAGYEIRRLSRRLERLEDLSDRLERDIATEYQASLLEDHQTEAKVVAHQIATARARLAELLDDPDAEGANQ